MVTFNYLDIESNIKDRFFDVRDHLMEHGISLIFDRVVTEDGHLYIYLEKISTGRSIAYSEIAELSEYLERTYEEMEAEIAHLPDSIRNEIRKQDYSPVNVAVARQYLLNTKRETERKIEIVA